ncbi:MAG TPA: FtsX-like permease family protein [Methylomirabilota bacterium]|nr:FtsX-like permease family protein [Methylomirabilota bacterium]
MGVSSWLAISLRELRGSAGRIAFFAACLAVGVAAVVAVAGLSTALDSAIRAQARQLLAADLAVESRRPIPQAVLDAVAALPRARWAEVRELPSVVSVPAADGPGGSLLAELKAVGEGYPFYGSVEVEPARPLGELLADDRVLVGPELLTRLDLAVGGGLVIGGERFTIAGVVISEPDRVGMSFTLGPRILLSPGGLDRTGLVAVGSRVEHRLLLGLPGDPEPERVAAAAELVRAAIAEPEFVELQTAAEAQPALRRGLDRVERFLGLVALLSLLIGGIGVAQAVRAWLAGRLDAIAALRALGVRPREVFGLYLGQTVVLALLGSVVGAVAGALVARAAPALVAGLLPVEVAVGWQPAAMARGVALGLGVALLFALRPLVDAMRVPPIRVLRRDAEPLPVSRAAAAALALALVAGIGATAAVQSGSLLRGAQFAGGLVAVAAVLAGSAWLVVWLVGRAPREHGPLTLRHGLAALARPGAGTIGAVVALGLGVVTVLGMFLVQERLSAQLDAELPLDAPTVFLVDIQPDQWPGVEAALRDAGARGLDSVEVVMARLAAIDGVPVAELVGDAAAGDRDRRWVLTREQRLTSLETLPDDNVVVEGALWSHPDRAEVSVERDFAADLGVGVGDTLTFDVQGVPLELLVSSLRTVEWESFAINFFLVVEPGVLERAPRFRIAAARLDAAAELPLQDRLAAAFPNVTVLRLREVLDKVVAVLEQLGNGVRILGAFTVLAGIAILGGAVSATTARRGRQAALFKTLGMTRSQVVAVFAVEYALVGVVAGVLGVVGAIAMSWAVVSYGFELPWAWRLDAAAASLAVTVLLSVAAGLAASVRALAVRPLAVLRRAE